jgi:hypothetical protein
MSFRIADFEHRKALMACFREIQDDDGNEYFTVQDDAYGYNADSQCVWVMLESQWEGYTLAVACPTYSYPKFVVGYTLSVVSTYSDAYFVVTNDETGEEHHYSTREALMEEEFLEEEDEEEEDEEGEKCSICHISVDFKDCGSTYDGDFICPSCYDKWMEAEKTNKL